MQTWKYGQTLSAKLSNFLNPYAGQISALSDRIEDVLNLKSVTFKFNNFLAIFGVTKSLNYYGKQVKSIMNLT